MCGPSSYSGFSHRKNGHNGRWQLTEERESWRHLFQFRGLCQENVGENYWRNTQVFTCAKAHRYGRPPAAPCLPPSPPDYWGGSLQALQTERGIWARFCGQWVGWSYLEGFTHYSQFWNLAGNTPLSYFLLSVHLLYCFVWEEAALKFIVLVYNHKKTFTLCVCRCIVWESK